MSKKSKRIPRAVAVNVMETVKHNIATLPSQVEAYRDVLLKVHVALESLRIGQVKQADVNHLTGAINMSLALYTQGVGPDDKETLIEAAKVINNLAARYINTGKYVAKGLEIVALRKGVKLHIEQLTVATPPHIQEAMLFVKQNERLNREDARRKTLSTVKI